MKFPESIRWDGAVFIPDEDAPLKLNWEGQVIACYWSGTTDEKLWLNEAGDVLKTE